MAENTSAYSLGRKNKFAGDFTRGSVARTQESLEGKTEIETSTESSQTENQPSVLNIIGLPYTTVSVREPIIDEEASRFVYNFYTEDERLGKEEKGMSFSTEDFTTFKEISEAQVDLGGIPRYNIIVFNHNPDLYNSALQKTLGGLINVGPRSMIDKFKQNATNTSGELIVRPDRIISEGTFANTFYKSATLLETNMDKKVYELLNMQILFDEIMTNTDQENNHIEFNKRVDAYEKRKSANSEYLNENLVRNFINQLYRSGQKALDAESGLTMKESYMLSVRQQSFLTGFRSTLIGDILQASCDDSCNVFEDELNAMRPFAKQAQAKAEDFENSTIVDNSFFSNMLGLGFLYDYSVDELTQFGVGVLEYPHVEHIGYVVQKTELTKEGDLVMSKSQFFGESALSEFIDTQVTYGRSYTYKIRSVSAVEYDFLVTNPENVPMKVRGLFFVGSKNATFNLKAIETTPPNPPNYLRFNYERNRGMLVEWDFPFNPQRDIVGFHVYRRQDVITAEGNLIPATQLPFTLIREIDFDNSAIKTNRHEKALESDTEHVKSARPWYLDPDFNNDSKFIYSVVSYDAHGMTSNYSPQYEITYDRPTNRINVRTISKQFAPKAYPNMFLNIDANISDLFKDNFKVIDKKRLTVFFNPDYSFAYEKKEIKGHTIPSVSPTPSNIQITNTSNVNLLQTSTEKEEPVYRLHMINVDLQKDEIFDICIGDNSTKVYEIPKPVFEENNFSFEMVHSNKYQQ